MTAYIVDTETTDKDAPEVIGVAWIQLATQLDLAGESDRIFLEEAQFFEQRYKPSQPSAFGAIAVHHILPSELENCPPSSEAKLPDDCTYMIGHSIDYDWQALGSPDVKRICTRAMAEHVWPDADSYSQSALIYRLLGAIPETRERLRNAHSAATDCENNLILLRHIWREKWDITTWSALWDFSEFCRIPLVMPITKARGEKLTDIDDGLLNWCLNQHWLPDEHPYLYKGLTREYERRQEEYQQAMIDKSRDKHDPDPEFDDQIPF
jgi:exodeoxyribonuclease X